MQMLSMLFLANVDCRSNFPACQDTIRAVPEAWTFTKVEIIAKPKAEIPGYWK